MTLEDAIKCLSQKITLAIEYGDSYAFSVNVEALEMAVKALKKQIGAKPYKIVWNKWETRVLCPQCNYRFYSLFDGERIAGKQSLYCPCCGQRIDWEEE